jgi:competence protein ComEC
VWVLATLAMTCLVEVAAVRSGAPEGTLRVTVLDVGQGDATLIDLPDGRLVLIDGGGVVGSPSDPGTRVILPLLRERRRRRIDVAILSHPHPDHFLGLASVLREIEVGQFWDTGQGREHGAGPVYAEMLRDLERRGVPIRGPASLCGLTTLGGATLRMFAPCPAFDPGLDANDNSFVISLGLGARRVLLTGDAEHEEEARLVRDPGGDLRADLLKVGHHGSRTSTSPELLDTTVTSPAAVYRAVAAAARARGVAVARVELVGLVPAGAAPPPGDPALPDAAGRSIEERLRAAEAAARG